MAINNEMRGGNGKCFINKNDKENCGKCELRKRVPVSIMVVLINGLGTLIHWRRVIVFSFDTPSAV